MDETIPELHDTEEFLEYVESKWNVGKKWAEYLQVVYKDELPDMNELDSSDWASLVHEAIHCATISSLSISLSQHVKEHGYPWEKEDCWEQWDMDTLIAQVISGVIYSLGAVTSVVLAVMTLPEATCEDLLIELTTAADDNVFSDAHVNWPTIGAVVGSFLSINEGGIPSIHDFLSLLKDLKTESE